MPLRIVADGFFQSDQPAEENAADASFVTCAAATAVQATWSKVAVLTSQDGSEADDDESFAVVYVGDPDAPLDNDRMFALRKALPDAFPGATVVIASSPNVGEVELLTELTGDELLRAAAIVGVVQAGTLWDRTDPLVLRCAHRTVQCRPTFDPATRLWRSAVERT